jgi:hypothetical protein
MLVLVGCGDDAATEITSVTKTIGPEGGEVALPDGASVNIPKGALDEDTDITVSRLSEDDAEALIDLLPAGLSPASAIYAFTPHGLKFNVAVGITLPFESASKTLSAQRLDDEDDETWAAQAGAEFDKSEATFETMTFSLYLVASGTATARDAGSDAMTVLPPQDAATGGKDASTGGKDAGKDTGTGDDDAGGGGDKDAGEDAGSVADILVRFTAADGTTTLTAELPGTAFGVEDNRPSDIFQGDLVFPLSDGTEIAIPNCDGGITVPDGCGVNGIPELPGGTYNVFMRGEFLSDSGTILTTNSLPLTINDPGSNQWPLQISPLTYAVSASVSAWLGTLGEKMGSGTFKARFTATAGGAVTNVDCTPDSIQGFCTFTVPGVPAGGATYDVVIIAGTGSDAVTSTPETLTIN